MGWREKNRPWIEGYEFRWGGGNWHHARVWRHPRTTQERRRNHRDHAFVRAARRKLPDYYFDIDRACRWDRNWKRFRMRQWKDDAS